MLMNAPAKGVIPSARKTVPLIMDSSVPSTLIHSSPFVFGRFSNRKHGISEALARLPQDPHGGLQVLKAQFSSDKRKFLLREHIEADLLRLEQRVHSFVRQLSDLVQIDIFARNDSFHFFRRLVNYDPWRIDGLPNSSHFLDYQVGAIRTLKQNAIIYGLATTTSESSRSRRLLARRNRSY